MEEAERVFQNAESCESNSENRRASELYTTFINLVKSSPDKHQLSEKLALAYNNRGFLKYREVDFDGAIADYSSSLAVNPKCCITYYNRGTVLYRLSKFDEAISDMKSALSLDPTFEPAKTGLQCAQQDREDKLKRGW